MPGGFLLSVVLLPSNVDGITEWAGRKRDSKMPLWRWLMPVRNWRRSRISI